MQVIENSHGDELSGEVSTLVFREICIDERKMLRIQGYRDIGKVRPTIKHVALSTARETETLLQPCAYFRCLDVQQCGNGILLLEDGIQFENEAFDRFLDGVHRVVIFAVTMGHPLDQAVKDSIADDQLLKALFLETAGWLGIEAATRQLSSYLARLVNAHHLRLSPRLGPGYSYKLEGRSVIWPLEQQQMLFKAFSGATMDIELLESCAMLPKISRSGLFGILPRQNR